MLCLRIFVVLICFACHAAYSEEIDLRFYEKRVNSQNGEDGILEKIFSLLEIDEGLCVEFGAMDGYLLSNTLQLRKNGWDAVLFDAGHQKPEISLFKEWITAENVKDIFKKYDIPSDFELLSIDIDSNDWYVWQALGKDYHPKVIIIEYNQNFGPSEDKIIVYDPTRVWNGSSYFGASLTAYYRLGQSLGYSLVYAESVGLNAIFIRNDLLAEKKLEFKNMNNPLLLYRGHGRFLPRLQKMPLKSSSDFL